MGSIWLRDMPDVLRDAGLNVVTYSGWENRARSSGGYDALLGIGIHHDASNSGSSDQSAWDWAWKNSSDKPIGCIRLGRGGQICVGAAGATNTMGKGGPLTTSRGTIPLDKGNQNMIAIEAGNNGVGETWGSAMIDAYIRMLAALCEAYNLDANRDIFTHHSYCAPSCPGRKIDPAGPTPSKPSLGGTSGCKIWSHDDVRAEVLKAMGSAPSPPTPEPGPEPTPPPTGETGEAAMLPMIGKYPNHGVWVVSFDGGRTHIGQRNSEWAKAVIAGGAIYAKGKKVVDDWGDVADFASNAEAEQYLGKKVG